MTPDPFNAPPLSSEDSLLMELYEQVGRPLDDLPYTEEFDRLYEAFCQKCPGRTKYDVVERLFRLRKAGVLTRLGHGLSGPVSVADEDVSALEPLVRKYAGTLGQRDRLPYTAEFDRLVEEFNRRSASKPLDAHAVWRLVARVAK